MGFLGLSWVDLDFACVFVYGGDIAGPDFKVKQGCQRLAIFTHQDKLYFLLDDVELLAVESEFFLSPVFLLFVGFGVSLVAFAIHVGGAVPRLRIITFDIGLRFCPLLSF